MLKQTHLLQAAACFGLWIVISLSTDLSSFQSSTAFAESQDRSGQVIFYRMLGSSRNAPFPVRTRTVCAMDGAEVTNTTGMARSGYTEYPFRKARMSYTFAENFCYFPRFVSGAAVDPDRVNTGDILIDHVYEPDPCVWGPSAREFVQTFVARGPELVSLTILIATKPGLFRAELLEGGPGGRPIGSTAYFQSGHSTRWGWARWRAGDAPLETGRVYGIKIVRADGEPFRPYLHSSGDAYSDGELYADSKRLPGSDLGAWILEEPGDVRRAIVEGCDEEGWSYGTQSVTFRPRSKNVRLIDVTLSPAIEKCRDVVLRVWSLDSPRKLLAGPKRCTSCTTPGTSRRAQFLFTENELRVEPGTAYSVEISAIPRHGEIPTTATTQAFDIRAWIYGEPSGKSLPAIYNLRWTFEKKADLRLNWSVTHPAKVAIELRRLSPGETKTVDVAPGTTEVLIPELWRGHDHDLSLVARTDDGREWRTPVYRFRPPGGPHPPPPAYVYPEHPGVLPQIRSPSITTPRILERIRARGKVTLRNADFEKGLENWQTTPADVIAASGKVHGVSPPFGDQMAGWSIEAGKQREQVFADSYIWQNVTTTPGNEYLLTARAHTSIEGGPRGDTRVRLCANLTGDGFFTETNGTQWYWTDGRWTRHEYRFRATGTTTAIGAGMFRWRDLDRASAYVDHLQLYDLGPSPQIAGSHHSRHQLRQAPRWALTESRDEVKDRVEAWLAAPPGYVITGIGTRAAGDNVTTMRLKIQPLLDEGGLGSPEYLFGGWEPDAGLEALIDLPAGYVATGFGARIAPEWDVKTFAVWARPLQGDGSLGEEKEFRAGVQPEGGLEKRVRLEAGRVLTGAGLRCHLNDVGGIRATSSKLGPTATGAQE